MTTRAMAVVKLTFISIKIKIIDLTRDFWGRRTERIQKQKTKLSGVLIDKIWIKKHYF